MVINTANKLITAITQNFHDLKLQTSKKVTSVPKMAMHRFLTIRLKKQHFEKIKQDASSKGYETVSEYLRSLLLCEEMTMHQKVSEIYKTIIGKEATDRKKIKEKPLLAYIK